ncbi:MAG: hypothetical protein HYV95_07890 [Opitutae bacterium]|nr:hypothetical protein [Opitutae bacterium]
MADKKIEKALYGPSTVEVALGALLGFLVGVVAACLFLVFLKPVQQVKEMPKADKIVPGVVYYLPGAENSTKGRNWTSKQKVLAAGGEVLLLEEELNAWSATLGTPAAPAPAPAKPGAKPAAPAASASSPAFLTASAPNFRIVGDKLQIGLKCTLNVYGLFSQEVIVLAVGDFAKGGDGMTFKPDSFYLGSCPLHKLPAATALIVARILAAQKIPDETHSMWAKITSASIGGGQVKIVTAP